MASSLRAANDQQARRHYAVLARILDDMKREQGAERILEASGHQGDLRGLEALEQLSPRASPLKTTPGLTTRRSHLMRSLDTGLT